MDILEKAREFRRFIEIMAESLDDETAENHADVFPKWEVGKVYGIDYRVRYNDVLYKVLQEHISQEDWTPDVAVSLYVRVHQQDPSQDYPDWVQPVGSQDAYAKGDRVSWLTDEHGNKRHWESLVDANVWEPGSVGTETLWGELTEGSES